MAEDVWIDLAKAIAALRQQLTDAINEGSDKGMHFELDPIELTVQASVTTKGNGKLGWKILEVGGGLESASTQTLTLKLTPVWKMQDGTVVPDPLIAATVPGSPGPGPATDSASGPGPAPDEPDPD